MAYSFNGINEWVRFDIAPLSGYTAGAFTWAIFFNAQTTVEQILMEITDSSVSAKMVTYHRNNDLSRLLRGSFSNGPVLPGTSIWALLVVTASGSVTPRFHVHNGTSWSHADGSAGGAGPTAIGSTDRMYVSDPAASFPLKGAVVCCGFKKADSTDLTVETLSRTAFSAWQAFGFDWLIGFDTSLKAGGLLQDQATPGTGDQVAINGTAVVSDPAGWSWAAAPAAPTFVPQTIMIT